MNWNWTIVGKLLLLCYNIKEIGGEKNGIYSICKKLYEPNGRSATDVDNKGHKMEALSELQEWSTILIHVPNFHRIAIVICAEFLAD